MLSTYMSSLVAQLLRLLHPPLDWKCRTLSLTSNFFIWVHITISVDSVEKSISSHCYSYSHSLLTCIHNRYYATMYSKALSNKFYKHFSSRSRKMVETQSASNADKTLQRTYDIILLCALGSKCSVINALTNNEQF